MLPLGSGSIESTASIRERFTVALDNLIAQVKQDRSILAAILCGSLSHDTVWAHSDIDLALITIDDKKAEHSNLALNADGVNVHAFLMPRTEFRKSVEGAIRNSFMHSLLAKGRLLYTHDETIAALCDRLREIGQRDTQLQLLGAATSALPFVDKAHKWFVTRGDLDYTALWILYAATSLARVEVIGAGAARRPRSAAAGAIKLKPDFFATIYTALLNAKKTRKNVEAALDAVDTYLAERAPKLFQPILDHLRDVGEARSATEIDFALQAQLQYRLCNYGPCEYLAEQHLIGKVSTPVQLTKRSNLMVQEQAFVYLGEAPDEY